jgi:hypothetical protein
VGALHGSVRISAGALKFNHRPPVRRASERGVLSPALVRARYRPVRLSTYYLHARASVSWPLRAPSRQGKRTDRSHHVSKPCSGRSMYLVSAGFPCLLRQIRTHQHGCSCDDHRDSYALHAERGELKSHAGDPPDQRARGRQDLRVPLNAATRTASYQ